MTISPVSYLSSSRFPTKLRYIKEGLRLEITYYVTTLNAEKSIYRINQLKEYFRNAELVTNKKDA